MNKALFLDRDGILIKERGDYNYLTEHFQVNENIIPLLLHATIKDYLLIVITNQGGIEKKLYSPDQVTEMHQKISAYFKSIGITFTDFFHCEHHDTISKCICRKPDSLMLEKACALHNIDPTKSFMVGDRKTDQQAGEKIGATGLQIEANTSIPNFEQLLK